jgi:hypothetical protein
MSQPSGTCRHECEYDLLFRKIARAWMWTRLMSQYIKWTRRWQVANSQNDQKVKFQVQIHTPLKCCLLSKRPASVASVFGHCPKRNKNFKVQTPRRIEIENRTDRKRSSDCRSNSSSIVVRPQSDGFSVKSNQIFFHLLLLINWSWISTKLNFSWTSTGQTSVELELNSGSTWA